MDTSPTSTPTPEPDADAGPNCAESHGSASVECDIVPDRVAQIADAFERGQIVIGGQRGGKTWATKMVMARPVTRTAKDDHVPDYGNDLRRKLLC